MEKMSYVRRVFIGLDQFFNAVLLGNPDETISSRVGKAARDGIWWGLLLEFVIDKVFEPGHCRAAIEEDEV